MRLYHIQDNIPGLHACEDILFGEELHVDYDSSWKFCDAYFKTNLQRILCCEYDILEKSRAVSVVVLECIFCIVVWK